MARETLTFHVVEVKNTLKKEKEKGKVKAYEETLADVMGEFKDYLDNIVQAAYKSSKALSIKYRCCAWH